MADAAAFARFKDSLYRKDWVVYAKRPFAGPEQVFKYLGRYTHRIGISNARLRSLDERGVTFATKDGKTITVDPVDFIHRFLLHVLPAGFVRIRHYGLHASSNVKTKLAAARSLLSSAPLILVTADPEQSTTTAPPTMPNNALEVTTAPGAAVATSTDATVAVIDAADPTPDSSSEGADLVTVAPVREKDWRDLFKDLTGIDLLLCPHCRKGKMVRYPLADDPDTS